MQGIDFEENNEASGLSMKTPEVHVEKSSFTIKLLEKVGVRDKASKNIILIGIAVICLGITIFIYARILNGGSSTQQTPEQIQARIKMMQETISHK